MTSGFFSEVYVNNLAPSTTEDDLKVMFSNYGVVMSVWLTQKKGVAFGVVRFSSHAEAAAAKKALNHSEKDGRLIGVKWSNNQRVLWVGSLSEKVTNEVLEAAFQQFGPLEQAVVVLDTLANASRRYGFVVFKDRKHASTAHARCQELPLLLGGSLVPVRVDWAHTDDWDQGYSEAAKAGNRAPSVTSYKTEAVAVFPRPGGADYALALRFRQLQAEYQAARKSLKEQLQQAEQALLMGAPQPALRTPQLGAMRPPPPAGPPPPVPPPTGPGMPPMIISPASVPLPGAAILGGPLPLGAPWPGAGPPPGAAGVRRERDESFHQVPPPKRATLRSGECERFNPPPPQPPKAAPASPHAPPPSTLPGFAPASSAPPAVPKFVHAQSAEFSTSGSVQVAGPKQQSAQPGGSHSYAFGQSGSGQGQGQAVVPAPLGAKPPGSHDVAGIGFTGSSSQQQQQQQPAYAYSYPGAYVQQQQPQAPPQQAPQPPAYAGCGGGAGGGAVIGQPGAGYIVQPAPTPQQQQVLPQLQGAATSAYMQYPGYGAAPPQQGGMPPAQAPAGYVLPPDMMGGAWQAR